MKKIGFIDYYLDEWHANNYPAWFKEQSGGEYEVCYAYGEIDCPKEGKLTNAEWCEKYGIELLSTIDEVVEKSDCLVVLAPDNCERHLALSLPAVASGKPVYIDKTFADSKQEAEVIFAAAEKSGSPCFSSSAFRFSRKLQVVQKKDISAVIGFGYLSPENYLVHQIEPMVILMGRDAKSVIFTGSAERPAWQIRFANDKTASINMMQGEKRHYFIINHQGANETVFIDDDFWVPTIDAILELFESGTKAVSSLDTIAMMAIREKCLEAMKKPFEWIYI